jgi:RNA polymerase sigma factor (sigma-70 family)
VRQADQQKYLALALARLPADDALVLTLHYLGEQSIAEICTILGKKTSAIKMQLLRSRQQLEAALLQLLPTEHQHLL